MKGAGKRKACGERGEGSEDKEEKGGGKGGKRAEGGGRTERQRRARRRGTQKQAGRGEVREMRRAEGGKRRRRMGEGRGNPLYIPTPPDRPPLAATMLIISNLLTPGLLTSILAQLNQRGVQSGKFSVSQRYL